MPIKAYRSKTQDNVVVVTGARMNITGRVPYEPHTFKRALMFELPVNQRVRELDDAMSRVADKLGLEYQSLVKSPMTYNADGELEVNKNALEKYGQTVSIKVRLNTSGRAVGAKVDGRPNVDLDTLQARLCQGSHVRAVVEVNGAVIEDGHLLVRPHLVVLEPAEYEHESELGEELI